MWWRTSSVGRIATSWKLSHLTIAWITGFLRLPLFFSVSGWDSVSMRVCVLQMTTIPLYRWAMYANWSFWLNCRLLWSLWKGWKWVEHYWKYIVHIYSIFIYISYIYIFISFVSDFFYSYFHLHIYSIFICTLYIYFFCIWFFCF